MRSSFIARRRTSSGVCEPAGSINRRTSKPLSPGRETASTVVELADERGVDMPIARTIHDVVNGRIRAADAYRGLIRAVPAGHESEPG